MCLSSTCLSKLHSSCIVVLLQAANASLQGTIQQLHSDTQLAMSRSESSAGQEKRLKHKALKLLAVCRKQERALAATVILYHHCFSDSVFHLACVHAKEVLGAAVVRYEHGPN